MRLKSVIFPINSLSLLVTSTLLTTGLSFSAAIFHPCGSAVQAARTFGSDGADGSQGANGDEGRAGRDSTINATGTPINVNLEGSDGDNGRRGDDAHRPHCGNQPNQPSHDLEAADGGDGGRGGDGGDGGDGGNITVYYQDRSALSAVYVNAAGGRGGMGAQGGRGTDGCDCDEDDWTVTTCSDGNCDTEGYDCKDGERGSHGRRGDMGKEGEVGRARLIQHRESLGESSGVLLAGDNPHEEIAIAASSSSPVQLSRNLWETRTGAKSIFAIGSTIGDEYDEYVGRVEQQFQLVWDAERSQSEASGSLNVALNEQGELQVTSPEELWIEGELSSTEELTTYRVNGAILQSEAVQLTLGRNSGRGGDFVVNVIDTANASDLVDTRFHLRYYTDEGDRRSRFISRYDAVLPDELVTQDYNRFSVALGNLPISARYLQTGTPVRVELTVVRSYAGNSAEQILTWNGRL